jgi:hypothetical protein
MRAKRARTTAETAPDRKEASSDRPEWLDRLKASGGASWLLQSVAAEMPGASEAEVLAEYTRAARSLKVLTWFLDAKQRGENVECKTTEEGTFFYAGSEPVAYLKKSAEPGVWSIWNKTISAHTFTPSKIRPIVESTPPVYTDWTTLDETGGTVGDARDYFALAAKAFEKGLSVAELDEAIEDKLGFR